MHCSEVTQRPLLIRFERDEAEKYVTESHELMQNLKKRA